METVAKLMDIILPTVIASFAVYIAWRQHQTARNKLKLDLFDRRFKVYGGVIDLLSTVLRDGQVHSDDLTKYHVETNAKEFLFDDDIVEFMAEVRKNAIVLRQVNQQLQSLRDDREKERHQLAGDDAELCRWFAEQLELAPSKFENYLGFKRNL